MYRKDSNIILSKENKISTVKILLHTKLENYRKSKENRRAVQDLALLNKYNIKTNKKRRRQEHQICRNLSIF